MLQKDILLYFGIDYENILKQRLRKKIEEIERTERYPILFCIVYENFLLQRLRKKN